MGAMAESQSPSEIVAKFAREVRAEARKVNWPNRRQTIAYTAVVVSTVVVTAGFIYILDTIFQAVFGLVIKA